MTKEVLERDGFGDEKFYRVIIAETGQTSDGKTDSRKSVGYTLFFFGYSTFEGRIAFVEDIYVTPEFRGQGIGTRLLKAVTKIGLEKDCARVCWNVLDWNTSSIAFYKSLGAVDYTEKEGWHNFRMRRPVMEKFANS